MLVDVLTSPRANLPPPPPPPPPPPSFGRGVPTCVWAQYVLVATDVPEIGRG